jgi:ribosomal protein S18 acetylase RimI-like enzyme
MLPARKSLLSDIRNITECYKECFPHSFSVQLGRSHIIKTFEWYLAGNNRFLFHIENADKVIGFCGGFVSQYPGDGSTSGMLQFAMREAVIGVIKKPWLLMNKEIISRYPLIIKNIVRKITPASKTNKEPAFNKPVSVKKKAGLVVIGVHPSFRGTGVFEMLMSRFEAEAVSRNISSLILSVKKNNYRAIKAYENTGWKVFKTDKKSLVMVKTLAD